MGNYAESQYYDDVVDIIANVLMLEKNEIEPESKVIDELGAESIDFLDILNRIEEKTSITLPDTNILKYLSDKYGKELFFEEGELTERGVKILQLAMPEVAPSKITRKLREYEIAQLLTPLTFVRMVEIYKELDNWKPEKCEKCESANFNKEDKDSDQYLEINFSPGPLYKCLNCEELISAPRIEEEVYKQVEA